MRLVQVCFVALSVFVTVLTLAIAIARVSGTVDTVVSTEGKTTQQAIESVAQLAIDRAVENGAVRETIELAEMDAIPLQVSFFSVELRAVG